MRPLTNSLACVFVLISTALGQDPVAAILERKLISRLQAFDRDMSGVLGVAAIDLQTGSVIQYNGNVIFPQASSIKIPIMLEVFRQRQAGRLDFDSPVTLTAKDAVGGSGLLQKDLKRGPVKLKVSELVTRMIRDSDNTATNQLITMAGMASVNQRIFEAGLKQTKLQRRMMDSEAAKQDQENISTPLEMARLAELLYRGRAVSADASKSMIEILKQVKAGFRASIPASVPVASKPGELDGVRAETGIVFLVNRPFVLSVMSTFLDDKTNPIPAVTQMFYRHFEKLARSNRYGNKLQ